MKDLWKNLDGEFRLFAAMGGWFVFSLWFWMGTTAQIESDWVQFCWAMTGGVVTFLGFYGLSVLCSSSKPS